MPKIFGTSLWGILAATVVFYILGALWYGVLFSEAWMAASGITEEMAQAHGEALGSMMYVYGIVITLMQVLGLTYILNQSGASRLVTCIKICVLVAVLIVLPIMLYAPLYEGRSLEAIGLDLAHILVAYALVGAILSFFRGKDAVVD